MKSRKTEYRDKVIRIELLVGSIALIVGILVGMFGPGIAKSAKTTYMELFYPSASETFRNIVRDAVGFSDMKLRKWPKDVKVVEGCFFRLNGSVGSYNITYKHPSRAFKEYVNILAKYGTPLQVVESPSPLLISGVQKIRYTGDVLGFLNALEVNNWLDYTQSRIFIGKYEDFFVVSYELQLLKDPRVPSKFHTVFRWTADVYDSFLEVDDYYGGLERAVVDSGTGTCWLFKYGTHYE
jgi:hypothetical protein